MLEDELKIGDLVTHVLYGRTWIGMIVEFRECPEPTEDKRKKKALVQIQPGTEFESFFKRASEIDRKNDNLGYVSVHWLFKVKEKDGNTGPTRSKTSPGRRNNKKFS